jgi:putative FmdB family regulatory protein
MPTYEYRCPDGHEFEQFVQKMSLASSELPCPVCGKVASRRISAGGGFVFKGSGFYITDYGKDGKKDQRDLAEKAAAESDEKAKGESGQHDAPARTEAPAPSESAASAREEKPTPPAREQKPAAGARDSSGKNDASPAKKAPATAPTQANVKKDGGAD